MLSMRENGVIEKIGVSIYNKPQLDKLLNRYDFDIVQAPINVLDQRLIKDGTLEFLYGKGIEVHARSSFLQGLLLMPLNKVPNYFSPILKNLIIWNNRLSDNGISLVEGALSYVCSLHQVKSVIVGVNSLMELEQCIKYGSSNVHINTSDIYCDDVNMIDPRLWTS
jgi:aryl-alcohol dehydrogenase-like predicted oxidoreductase